MTTSPVTSLLSKPKGKDDDARIPEWVIDYVRERGQQDIHSLVLREFRRAGITQATLAARLGHQMADRICRYLRTPGNWTIGTAAELLFAISGKIITFGTIDPKADTPEVTTNPNIATVVYVGGHAGRPIQAIGAYSREPTGVPLSVGSHA